MLRPATQARRRRWFGLALRLLVVVTGLWTTGWLLHRMASRPVSGAPPPGFAAGVAHGALMPMAMPRLLVGVDASIYATENSGRMYKLGYTCGVNGCGAIFFGLLYRRRAAARKEAV